MCRAGAPVVWCALMALALLPGPAFPAPFASVDVLCGPDQCGTMQIDTYTEEQPDAFLGVDGAGGAEITGSFKAVKPREYHYIQAATINADIFRWFNDVSVPLPVPFIDAAPGGFMAEDGVRTGKYTVDQPHDYLPWYDREGFPSSGNFPNFVDLPRASLLYAKGAPDGVLTFAFETWLVCVIGDTIIDNNVAKDDTYTVAPLIGWVWGFDITYKDVGEIGVDELVDFTVKKRAFAFVTTPSATWTKALGAKYGAGDKQDFWNIATGACPDCKPVPAASTLALVASGLGALVGGHAIRRQRRRRAPAR